MKVVTVLAVLVALAAVARGQEDPGSVGAPTSRPKDPQTTSAPEEDSAEASTAVPETTETPSNSTNNATDEEPLYQVGYKGAVSIVYNLEACESVVAKMSCPKFHYIYIYSAFWGRANNSTCSRHDDADLDLRCENEFAVNVVKDYCEGKSDCQFMASADNLGWICNTPKYLHVEYQCYAPLYHSLVCQESGTLDLTCPPGKYIEIRKSFWGRADDTTCPHANIVDTDCSDSYAYPLVSEMCNGKASCPLDAHTDLFGNPCPGTVKYLKVDYTCAECLNAWESDADCEYWAAQGDCTSSWMQTNCRRTCWKCGTKEQEAATCINDYGDDDCARYASDGQCESNAVWMHAYCKRSCLKCDNLTPCRNVYDDDRCDNYATKEVAECKNNVYWMHQHCAKSCWDCEKDHIECIDRHTKCEEWANADECQFNPGYMIPFCTRSCTGCTKDPVCENEHWDEANCEYWASIGECERNAAYMYKKCWKSCMACGDVAPCVNWYGDDVQCEIWKKQGQCENNMAWMTAFCKKTCLECDLKCTNMLGDPYCDREASRGQCELNPIWMHQRCLKTCQRCDDPLKCVNKAGNNMCDYWVKEGECDANPGWMYYNCRLSCTRCAAVTNVHECVDLNVNCSRWADANECINNPWYMIPTCRRSCTKCDTDDIYVQDTLHTKPHHIGEIAAPGEEASITRGSTFLSYDKINSYGRLMNFEVFFVNRNPVHLQIWRYNTTSGKWRTVYDERITPDHSNTAQTIAASHPCVQLWTGDYIGFTTYGNVSPIAANLDWMTVFKKTMYHDAGTNRGFVSLNLPYKFSFGVTYDVDATCK